MTTLTHRGSVCHLQLASKGEEMTSTRSIVGTHGNRDGCIEIVPDHSMYRVFQAFIVIEGHFC